jgi:LuxR family transcriptional regulator, maltose regulon positive regulatory protein
LLQTAFLPHLTSAMAAALTGRPHAGRVLARLHRQNCFTVGHAAASAVYEYHPLFRAFLLRRAYAVLTVEQRADIQRRAAVLLERDGQLDAAAGLLRDAGDWSALALLVQSHSPALIHDARARLLADWIAAIPPEVTHQHPGLLLRRAAGRLVTEPSAARADLETALTLFRRAGDTTGSLLSWALIIETFALEHDDIRALDTWIATGEKLLLEIPTYPSIDVETRVASSMLLALMCRQPHHRDVNRWLARTIELADKASDVDVRVSATVAVLTYQVWLGDLDNALVRADDARTLLRSPAVRLSGRIAGYLTLVRLAWLTGDFDAARETAEAAMALDRDSGGAFRHRLAVEAAMAAVSSGDAMQARRWLADLGRDLPHLTRQIRGYYHLTVGWDALQRGDFSAALGELEKLLTATWQCGMPWLECLARMFAGQVALAADVPDSDLHAAQAAELVRQFNSPLFEFEALLTEADAARRGGDAARAMQILGRALPIGRAHGYINTWLWSSPTMAELAALALDAEVEVDYVRRVVRERKLVPADASVETDAWPWPVKILTLGRFEVVTNERPVRFRGKAQRKPLALLQALVALGGHRVREDRLTEVLWPDADGDAARQALATTLHRLRRLIGVEGAIVRADGGISLARDRCWVDVWAIERMIARAESAIARSPVRDHEWASSVRWTDRAVALYRGDFLGGDFASAAAAGVGERIRDRLLRQLRRLGHLWESIGDWEEAAECYERAVALNECAEEFYRRLMVAYQRLDRRGDAILTYERCRKNLSSAFGIAPSSATEAVRRGITPDPTP